MHGQPGRLSRRRFLTLAGAAAALAVPGVGLCASGTPTRDVRVLSVHHHDPHAFTQGLLLADGVLYESTGQYGRSDVRKVDPATGRVMAKHRLPYGFFGEGLARAGDTLYQLTWREGIAFLYDAATLRPTGRLAYRGEGWGLAWDGARFFMTDGSAQIACRNRAFRKESTIDVRAGQEPVDQLNELELLPGALLANVWKSWRVAYMDAETGRVLSWIDLTPLRNDLERRNERYGVANGLAWDGRNGRLLVTGKNWPLLYAVRI